MGAQFVEQHGVFIIMRQLSERRFTDLAIVNSPDRKAIRILGIVGEANGVYKGEQRPKALLSVNNFQALTKTFKILYLAQEYDGDWVAADDAVYQ